MATPTPLQSATDHHARSALLARRAVRLARRAASRGPGGVAEVVVAQQVTQAAISEAAVGLMLLEQGIRSTQVAPLRLQSFTSSPANVLVMLAQTGLEGFNFEQLIYSLVQDAGRSAESVSIAARPRTGWVRHLTPPSCSRCVPLAGRVYRYSDGFLRHPRDDCVTTPVAEGDTSQVADPVALAEAGQVTGLSKADRQALRDGADFNLVVNARRARASLTYSSRVLARRGRLTPEGIYASTGSRDEALAALQTSGYLL